MLGLDAMKTNLPLLALLLTFVSTNVFAAASPVCSGLFHQFPTLLSPTQFIREFSDGGMIYHGTEIAAARYFVSHQQIAYTESDLVVETTGAYGKTIVDAFLDHKENGVVLPLRFKNLGGIRVGHVEGAVVDSQTAKSFAAFASYFDIVVLGKPFRQTDNWPAETNQIIILNADILLIPSLGEVLEDLDFRLRPRFESTSLTILHAYQNLFNAASPDDRNRATPPAIFLKNRTP